MEMKRETGYYWAMLKGSIEWQSCYYNKDGNYWYITGEGYGYTDSDFTEINETRILNPDER